MNGGRRHRVSSLRSRIALLAVGLTALWLTVLTIAFNVLLVHQLHRQADAVLRTRAAAAATTLVVGPAGVVVVREGVGDVAIDAGTWFYDGRLALQRPAGATALQRRADALAGTGAHFTESDEVRLYALPVRYGGRQVATVVTSLGLEPYRRTEQLAQFSSVALAAVLLALIFATTRMAVARALRPVTAMTEQAALWSAREVGRRFGAAQRPVELDALAHTLDGVLDRLSAVLRHEQQLSAELSHELRTPLAGVLAELDLLERRPRSQAERAEAYDAIRTAAQRMSTILETLLSAARSDADVLPGRAPVGSVLREVAGPEVAVDGPEEMLAGVAPDVLARIVAPLLDNARRYARTRRWVVVRHVVDGVEIAVHDDGPGVPAASREAVFEPGRRADPSDGHDGAGLGLALARRLARASGGDVCVRDGAFVVVLPAA